MHIDIPGYEGRYAITRSGRIKSLGVKGRTCTWMTPSIKRGGYLGLTLWDGKRLKNYKVHRLVAITYLENPSNLREINHKNGDKLDNRVSNLEWCTRSDNMKHAYRLGLRQRVYV